MRLPFCALLFCLLIGNPVFPQQTWVKTGIDSINRQSILDTVYHRILANYVDSVVPQKLMRSGIEGMLGMLDPFSTYLSKAEAAEFRLRINGKFGGLGLVFAIIENNIVIRQVFEGFPADKAGLTAGDIILAIDSQVTAGKSVDDIFPLLRGTPGSAVRLTWQRPGNKKEFTKNLVREEIKLKAVPYYGILSGRIGYIKFTGFSKKCGDEIRSAILDMNSKHSLKGLILDLRDNPGGLIDEAIKISNIFLKKGDAIVRVTGRHEDSTVYANDSALIPQTPLVILTNKNTASASEVFTGAMEDNDRAAVIGQKTFGKGLVGVLYDLQGGSILKLTVAHYYTPGGRCIQAKNYPGNGSSETGIPDSLKKTFKTKNGRTVRGSDGITPDLILASDDFPPIAYWLLDSNFVFKYAFDYLKSHPSIPPPSDFHLTEQDFDTLTHMLAGKDFAYLTSTETKLNELRKTAETEGYGPITEAGILEIQEKLKDEKQKDLTRHRAIIQKILEEEIAAWYYGEKGRMQATVKNDPEISEALRIMTVPAEYRKILNQ